MCCRAGFLGVGRSVASCRRGGLCGLVGLLLCLVGRCRGLVGGLLCFGGFLGGCFGSLLGGVGVVCRSVGTLLCGLCFCRGRLCGLGCVGGCLLCRCQGRFCRLGCVGHFLGQLFVVGLEVVLQPLQRFGHVAHALHLLAGLSVVVGNGRVVAVGGFLGGALQLFNLVGCEVVKGKGMAARIVGHQAAGQLVGAAGFVP